MRSSKVLTPFIYNRSILTAMKYLIILVLFVTLKASHLVAQTANPNDATNGTNTPTMPYSPSNQNDNDDGVNPNWKDQYRPNVAQPPAETEIKPSFQNIELDERSGTTEYNKEATEVLSGDIIVAKEKKERKPRFVYATMELSFPVGSKRKVGKIKIKLHQRLSPRNVENFIQLIEGDKEFVDPKTRKSVKRAYYDGLTIHRVTKNFLVQGGDPKGDGTGDPGYRVQLETSPNLSHDRPGVVSMFNAGQFFITLSPVPSLDNKHTIIGQVVDGMAVLDIISKTKTTRNDRPRKKVLIKSIKIDRVF